MFFFLFSIALVLTPSAYSTPDKPTDKIFKEVIENADKEQQAIEQALNQQPQLIKDLPGIKLEGENLPMLTAFLSPYCPHCFDLIKDLIKLDQEKTHTITLAFSVDSKNDPEARLVAVAFWTAYQAGGKESLSCYLEQFTKSLAARQETMHKELQNLFGEKEEWSKEELSELISKNNPFFNVQDLDIISKAKNASFPKQGLIHFLMQQHAYFSQEDLLKIASQAGLTADGNSLNKFKESLNSPTIFEDQLNHIHETSQKLKIGGFPIIVFEKNSQYKAILGRPRSLESLKKELEKS
ncbi:MAG: hypothetical protein BGO07_05025 [Alphaproteobacteria bacterium 40-19]|nr:MAG: hypothetical protein BGO07_05025 [Alphaproteobacteria bacterium 40-19]